MIKDPAASFASSSALALDSAQSAPASTNARFVHLTQLLAIGSLIALIGLCLAWELRLAPLREGGSWLCVKALPLCIPLIGLLKKRLYTFRSLSLWIWFYFTEGVVRAWSDTAVISRVCAALEVLLCLLLFTACAVHVRMRFRNAAEKNLDASAGQSNTPAPMPESTHPATQQATHQATPADAHSDAATN